MSKTSNRPVRIFFATIRLTSLKRAPVCHACSELTDTPIDDYSHSHGQFERSQHCIQTVSAAERYWISVATKSAEMRRMFIGAIERLVYANRITWRNRQHWQGTSVAASAIRLTRSSSAHGKQRKPRRRQRNTSIDSATTSQLISRARRTRRLRLAQALLSSASHRITPRIPLRPSQTS
jgi:hypothetical protein